MHFFFKKHATISQDITRQRAANPPQSQNLILSIVTEVGCPPSLFNFPETWLVADRMMLCTTKNFVKSFSAQITSKCCKDGVSQPIKWEIFSIFPIAFPLLMRCFELICHLTSYILQWVTGKSQEADTALHMLVALHWSYNAWKLFCMYILPRNVGVPFFFFLTRFTTWELAFSFGMTIWNDWKQKSSHQEVRHNQHHRHEKGIHATSCWHIWCTHTPAKSLYHSLQDWITKMNNWL